MGVERGDTKAYDVGIVLVAYLLELVGPTGPECRELDLDAGPLDNSIRLLVGRLCDIESFGGTPSCDELLTYLADLA